MKKVFKWIGIVLGGLVGLVVVAALVLTVLGSLKVDGRYPTDVSGIAIPTGAEAIARGKHLVEAVSLCGDCHGPNLGGNVLLNDPKLAVLAAPNLTNGQGGVGAAYTDADFVRSIRQGVRPDGSPLFIMPSNYYAHYSDEDLGAIIAYIRSVEPVDNLIPKRQTGILGRILIGAGMFPTNMPEMLKASGAGPSQVASGETKEYGEYISYVAACRDCHGPNFAGNIPSSQAPYGPNLTPSGELARWTEADFLTAFHTGQTPTGRTLSDDMPWKKYGQMTDMELKALWAYLSSLQPLPTNPTR